MFGKDAKGIRRPLFSWESYRLLFDLAFWLMLAITYLGYVIVFVGKREEVVTTHDMRLFGLLPVTLAFAAVAVLWHLLPWEGGVRPQRYLVVPLFLASVFWANYSMAALDRVFYWPFFLLAFAHGVFLFGPKRGALYAGGVLALVFLYLLLTSEEGVLADALLVVAVSPSVLFVVAASAAILEATRRRREAQGLLAELEGANAELKDYAGKVRELAVSEERTRMAREIHDSVGHYLTVVNVQLEAANKLLDKRPGAARGQLEKAKASASNALSEVRRSVRALKPLDVTEKAGAGALAALVRGFEGAGPAVRFEVAGEERELPPEVELVLYRTLQEGLTNALKHSGASRVEARLSFEPGAVALRISDDGRGAPDGFMEGGFGLEALRERAGSLGGTARAGNAPEGGFRLEVELPTADRGTVR